MLTVPADLRYACLGCGRCCGDFDEIAIDAAYAERLRRLPLFRADLPAAAAMGLPYVPSRLVPGTLALRSIEVDGHEGERRCVFLDDARRCAIHATHGAEAKPPVCRAFPFHVVQAPGGDRATLSFACTAVLRDHGPLLADDPERYREELAIAVRSAEVRAAGGIHLSDAQTLTPEAYASLEAELVGAAHAAPSAAAALLEQRHILLRHAGLEVSPRTASRPPSEVRGSPAQESSGAELQEQALRMRSRTGALSLMLELITVRVADPAPDASRAEAISPHDLERRLAALVSPAGRVASEESLSDRDVEDRADRLLRRWLVERVRRKDLLRPPHVLFAHGLALLEHGVAIAIAQTLARERGSTALLLGDVEEGVRAVEQHLGLHATFARDVARSASSRRRLEELFADPAFPTAMTCTRMSCAGM